MSDERDLFSFLSHAGAGGTAAVIVYLYQRFGRREDVHEDRDRLRDIEQSLDELTEHQAAFRQSVLETIIAQREVIREQTAILRRIDEHLWHLRISLGGTPPSGPQER